MDTDIMINAKIPQIEANVTSSIKDIEQLMKLTERHTDMHQWKQHTQLQHELSRMNVIRIHLGNTPYNFKK